ncbi:MAG: FKBP-type peptidyl-prolyl cis-trans isomerase, partial [Deltaproteobacteria bacterium]|nr:FKBP-type peptidyl-prolyl cis-trans isomerase [Deltaproteobacteria bacterium]
MRQARLGDTVKVHYTGTIADGTEFDSTRDRGPLEFTIGRKQVVLGFERAVLGMAPGTMKIENIPSSQAFGDRDRELVIAIDRARLGTSAALQVGAQVAVKLPGGKSKKGVITELTDELVTVDANHALAGQNLTFEIELVEIIGRDSRVDEGLGRVPKG